MRNNKGFTLIEVFIAASIIFMLATTIAPMASLLLKEREVLSEQRIITSRLHDELQPFLWNEDKVPPSTFIKKIKAIPATFHFSYDGNFIKGCVKWRNAKNNEDKVCLYGIPEK